MSSSGYEILASEYYDHAHITSRNFDSATANFCKEFAFPLIPKGVIVELGAGRGRTREYCRIPESRIIQTDLSYGMLQLNSRENSIARVQCSALELPFKHSSMSAITAFLYDPYNRPKLYSEMHRVMKTEGIFIGTLPHHVWGESLRNLKGIDANKARIIRFTTDSKEFVEMDSYLMNENEIADSFHSAGFGKIEFQDLFLPREIKCSDISPHIAEAASSQEISPYELPIVTFILGWK